MNDTDTIEKLMKEASDEERSVDGKAAAAENPTDGSTDSSTDGATDISTDGATDGGVKDDSDKFITSIVS